MNSRLFELNEEYLTEAPYPIVYHQEHSLGNIKLALLLGGFQGPQTSQEFTICEMGCGPGLTITASAALYPRGRFWAVDLNPEHIALARRLALTAGLENIICLDQSFAETLQAGLPIGPRKIDIIILHGVCSWISEENRQLLVEFIRRNLALGGVVYNGYNSLPGWAPMLPVRDLLRGIFPGSHGLSQGVRETVDLLGKMLATGAGYLQDAAVKEKVEKLLQAGPGYILHEYMHAHWKPFFFAEMAKEMAGAGLKFLAPAAVLKHIPDLLFNSAAAELIESLPGWMLRQTMVDFLTNSSFRADLFGRGVHLLPEKEKKERLSSQPFMLALPKSWIPDKIVFPAGEMQLNKDIYVPILEALAEKPYGLKELLPLTGLPPNSVFEALMILAAKDYIRPLTEDPDQEKLQKRTAAFNQAIIDFGGAAYGNEIEYLLSPRIGGIQLSRLNQLFLAAAQKHLFASQAADYVFEHLRQKGDKIYLNGRLVSNDTPENRKLLTDQAEEFKKDLFPHLQVLQVGY